MARFKKLPPDYAPGLVLDLRSAPEGGELKVPGTLGGVPALRRRAECLVLVHGFNNHAGEAATAYLGFRTMQREQCSDLSAQALEQLLGDAFWPGDARWSGPADWLDFLVYPAAVDTARNAGPALAALLRTLQSEGLLRVSFIGHSLGCRVVLEAVRDLVDHGGPALGRIALMAAAVPIEMVFTQGQFETLLQRLQAERIEVSVLHSNNDWVLRGSFPPGQALAGPSEASIRALGLKGPPPSMPGQGGNVAQVRMADAGHSDYWGHERSDAAIRAARQTGRFFQLGALERELAVRAATDTRNVGTARPLGAVREVGDARGAAT